MGVEDMARRAFLKGVLAGAAGGVMPQIAIGADAAGGATQPITDTGPTALSLSEASRLLRQKRISPVELAQACLARIESLNPTLNAFITVTAESALATARSAEAQIARGGLSGNGDEGDRKSTRLNSSHVEISYAVFCLKKKRNTM